MNNADKTKSQESSRKVYQSPKVVIYGDIGTITQGGAMSTSSDSGMNSMSA